MIKIRMLIYTCNHGNLYLLVEKTQDIYAYLKQKESQIT